MRTSIVENVMQGAEPALRVDVALPSTVDIRTMTCVRVWTLRKKLSFGIILSSSCPTISSSGRSAGQRRRHGKTGQAMCGPLAMLPPGAIGKHDRYRIDLPVTSYLVHPEPRTRRVHRLVGQH